MRRALAAALAALLLTAPAARASGRSALEFMSLSASARASALGGAYTALSRDADALHYNPAGLGVSGVWEASFMDNEYFGGVSQQVLGLSAPSGWGLHLNNLGYGETERTTVSNPNGTLGTFAGSDLALSGGYARAVRPGWRVGAGLKYIRERIDDVTAAGMAFDFGARVEIGAATLGASIRNLGRPVRFQRVSESLPLSVNIGAARRFRWLGREHAAVIEAVKQQGDRPAFSLGVEGRVIGGMGVRVGYDMRPDAGPGVTFGLGWSSPRVSVDYAFAPLGELGTAHRFGLSARWGLPRVSSLDAGSAPAPAAAPSSEQVDERLRQAELLYLSDKVREAERLFRSVEKILAPGDRRLLPLRERLGDIAMLQGYGATAKVYYTAALEAASALGISDSYTAQAALGLARVLLQDGDRELARKFFLKALGMDLAPELRAAAEGALKELDKRNPKNGQ